MTQAEYIHLQLLLEELASRYDSKAMQNYNKATNDLGDLVLSEYIKKIDTMPVSQIRREIDTLLNQQTQTIYDNLYKDILEDSNDMNELIILAFTAILGFKVSDYIKNSSIIINKSTILADGYELGKRLKADRNNLINSIKTKINNTITNGLRIDELKSSLVKVIKSKQDYADRYIAGDTLDVARDKIEVKINKEVIEKNKLSRGFERVVVLDGRNCVECTQWDGMKWESLDKIPLQARLRLHAKCRCRDVSLLVQRRIDDFLNNSK